MLQMLVVLGGGTSWFRSPVEVQRSVDRLVLEQGPSTFIKLVMYGLALLLPLGLYLCYRTLFTTQTTTFACDRATGKCTLDGNAAGMPALADIKDVELEKTWAARQGDFYWITLRLKDGGKQKITPQGAQQKEVVAQYRAALDKIKSFLADSAAPRLETSFTFRSSLGQKFYTVTNVLGGASFLFMLLPLNATSTFTFDKNAAKATFDTRTPVLGTKHRDVAFADIQSIDESKGVALKLASSETVVVWTGADAELAGRIAELVGKPRSAGH